MTVTVRKFYNGLGQLIQTQTVGATLVDNACSSDGDSLPDTCDILADTQYDAAGRATRQTVPYAAAYTSSFLSQTFTQSATRTAYDALGRTTIITGTDGTTSKTFYLFLETHTQDPRGNRRCTHRRPAPCMTAGAG